jgi:hypothetical protein
MAVFTYGANNISFETFQTWSNSISAATNTSLATAVDDFSPANSAPFQVSEFAPNTSIFYGAFSADTGGTVKLTAPYTVAATSSFTAKNVLISTYSITAVAETSYPWTFHSWRTATGGGGTQLSTNATLTLTDSDHTSVNTFYAYFTTTHINPDDTAF